jgi:hypothetical protein
MLNKVDFIKQYEELVGQPMTGGELGEQDDAAADSGEKSNVTTWSQIVGSKVSRGKANPLMKSDEKWVSGVARTGPANQLF